jgi:integrase
MANGGYSVGSVRARKDNGQLFFDFRFRGQRCREQTLLDDTPANRKRLGKALAAIESEIKAGSFDYSKAFPGSRAHLRPIATAAALASAAESPQRQPAAAPAGSVSHADTNLSRLPPRLGWRSIRLNGAARMSKF